MSTWMYSQMNTEQPDDFKLYSFQRIVHSELFVKNIQ